MALTLGLSIPHDLTLPQWLSIAKLATGWKFSEIRSLAMRYITESKAGSYDYWFATLQFSWNLVEFDDLRELAIARLSNLIGHWTAVVKIRMGRQYLVRRWVSEGLLSLVIAPGLPSMNDLQSLGADTVLRFIYLRDEVIKNCANCGSKLSCNGSCRSAYGGGEKRARCDLTTVEKHFNDELSRLAT
ncbi:hypothetical protein V5O48_019055 [Marasmius crinis-equi]|uniref:Uncharacterized protein n=1 Tax=Marasmius crinis-equi TaxID=585013 RepID=A0ABR3EJF7_9AGAR